MASPRRIVFALYEDIQSLDLTGPWEVFNTAAARRPGAYELVAASIDGEPVASSSGLAIATTARLAEIDVADTLVVPGGSGTLSLIHISEPTRPY